MSINQKHIVNDTELNKIYAFDKIAKLLSNNKFEAITSKEEVRGLHRDSETGKVSEYVYTTFLGKTEYKLNLTSDEVWELLCYVLEGMDKVIDENGCQITKDAFGFKHEYGIESDDREDSNDREEIKKETKEDGIDGCDNCNADNVNNSSCNFDNIPVFLSCDESNKVSVEYELVYSDNVDEFWGFDAYAHDERSIDGINLYGGICDGTVYKDHFDIQSPENWSKFKEEINTYDEDLTYFNKSLNRYDIDWDRILQLYKEAFYTTSGYRWIAKPCKNIIYNDKKQIDKLNRKFDESRVSKITSKQGTLTAGYKKQRCWL